MPLYKIQDFNPNYREEALDSRELKGIDIYTHTTNEKIGSIHDVLVDETGRFRYFVVDTGFWMSGKKVLFPVARCRIDRQSDRAYAVNIDRKEQLENMPDYNDSKVVDYDYEEQVRSIYRTSRIETPAAIAVEDSPPVEMWATVEDSPPIEAVGVEGISSPRTVQPPVSSTPAVPPPVVTPPQPTTPKQETPAYERDLVDKTPIVETSATVEDSPPLEAKPLGTEDISRHKVVAPPASSTPVVPPSVPTPSQPAISRRETYSYDYERDPDLYQLNERDHYKFKLYEERLVASKSRRKTGDVSIGKRVETSTASASVPVEKEKVVIERNTPQDIGKVVNRNEANFNKDTVARMDVYEETADIDKQTVVKEEVEVRKEVIRDTVEASEEIRREELEVDTEGRRRLDNEKRAF